MLITRVSNAPGFGIRPAIGHIDFYPNGGEEMPGCDKNALSQIVDIDGIWEGKCVVCITNSGEGHPSKCSHLPSFLSSGVLH